MQVKEGTSGSNAKCDDPSCDVRFRLTIWRTCMKSCQPRSGRQQACAMSS